MRAARAVAAAFRWWARRGGTAEVPERPGVVLLVAWEPNKAGDAVRLVAAEVEAFRTLMSLLETRAAESALGGDELRAAWLRGKASAFEEAASHVEEALMEALDLWEQYERQDPGS